MAEGTCTPLVTGENITNVTIGKPKDTSTDYAVNVRLDAEGTAAFAEATTDLVSTKGKIVIILDDEVQFAPAVQSEILDGDVSITGNYTLEEAKSLQTVLESGSLPVSFEYAQSQVVGPTLGQDRVWLPASWWPASALRWSCSTCWWFHQGLGLVTAAAMAVFAVLYLGILAALSAFGLFSLSLAGIAGIVLTIGMAADSSILTMERFREEIRMGRSVRAASITGVKHAIVTSVDADLVTLVSALSLFFLASASVKGFGLTLALGIVCDIVMMLLFKAPLIRLLAPRSIAKHPAFWGVRDSLEAAKDYEALAAAEGTTTAEAEVGLAMDSVESERVAEAKDGQAGEEAAQRARHVRGKFIKHDINFLGHRRVFLGVAAVLVAASFVVVGVRGLNFGIEFVGGTSVAFHGTEGVTTEQMRTAFDQAGEPDAVIQTTDASGEEGFLVRTTTTSAEEATARANQVADDLGLSTDSFEVTTIGPDWGASVIQSSLIAFLVSIVLIIVYIAIRFEYKMGIMAIVGAPARPCPGHGRVRARGPRGEPQHHRRAAHHSGLFALRHGGRVPPHQRQHEGRRHQVHLHDHGEPLHQPGARAHHQHHAHLAHPRCAPCSFFGGETLQATSPSPWPSAWCAARYSSYRHSGAPLRPCGKTREPRYRQAGRGSTARRWAASSSPIRRRLRGQGAFHAGCGQAHRVRALQAFKGPTREAFEKEMTPPALVHVRKEHCRSMCQLENLSCLGPRGKEVGVRGPCTCR